MPSLFRALCVRYGTQWDQAHHGSTPIARILDRARGSTDRAAVARLPSVRGPHRCAGIGERHHPAFHARRRAAHRGRRRRPPLRRARHRRSRRRRDRARRGHRLQLGLRPRRVHPRGARRAGAARGRPRRDGRLRHHPVEADPRRLSRQDRQHPSRAAARVQGLARGRGGAGHGREGHRLHGAPGAARGRRGADPRPGGGSGPGRRHRRLAPRADQGSRTSDLSRGAPDVDRRPRRANGRRLMRTKITRALLSVYDKTGIVEFARELHTRGIELVSSGGTAKAIADAGIPVTAVDDITGVPPILDHRVVTLHPKIHGGILADRSKASHDDDMATYGIQPFDVVVSNLYPFAQDPGIETIDVGGPAMVRAAAKNHAFVTVVTDASQYAPLLEEMDANDNTVGDDTRRAFAVAAFASTAAFDAQIVAWLQEREDLPTYIDLALERTGESLRYGENPHQRGARYRVSGTSSSWDDVEQHAGLALSYLNLYDADAAWRLVHDLGNLNSAGPAVAIIKHANPCGVALASDLATAYQRALECDERSAFGGIVALNYPVDAATAERMVAGPQTDLIMAPSWEPGTIEALIAKRKNTRLLSAGPPEPTGLDFRQISGGFLVQDPHHFATSRSDWRVVTKLAPTDAEWRDAELAWR